MEQNKTLISENDTVFDTVTKHPDLKEKLLELSPKYERLNHPVIFNTVAKITTIKKAASVGGIYWKEFVYRLNDAIGLGKEYLEKSKTDAFTAHGTASVKGPVKTKTEKPDWFDKAESFEVLDARNGGEPFFQVTEKAKTVASGSGFVLVQGFEPLPLIGYLETMGFEHYTERPDETEFKIYFYRK